MFYPLRVTSLRLETPGLPLSSWGWYGLTHRWIGSESYEFQRDLFSPRLLSFFSSKNSSEQKRGRLILSLEWVDKKYVIGSNCSLSNLSICGVPFKVPSLILKCNLQRQVFHCVLVTAFFLDQKYDHWHLNKAFVFFIFKYSKKTFGFCFNHIFKQTKKSFSVCNGIYQFSCCNAALFNLIWTILARPCYLCIERFPSSRVRI